MFQKCKKYAPMLSLLLFGISLLLFLVFTAPMLLAQSKFQSTLTDLFQEEMRSDTLALHYTVKSPKEFGILQYTPTLFCTDKENDIEDDIATLASISKEKLSEENRFLYQSLMRKLRLTSTLSGYAYYGQPLSLNGGAMTTLLLLLAEYSFDTEKDIQDYLELLSQTGDYLGELGTYQTKRADLGYRSSASLYQSMEETATRLSSLGPRILQVAFAQKLKAFSFAKEKEQSYIDRHSQLLTNTLSTGYTHLAECIHSLCGSASDTPLCELPDGRNYYKALLQLKTGSLEDPDTLRALLYQNFQSIWEEILALSTTDTQAENMDALFQNLSEEEILNYLQEACKKAYPALANANPVVKTVWPGMEEITAPAFYLTTPIGNDTNVIYLNKSETVTPQETFATLAHEGFPGHLYQNVYQNEHQSKLQLMAGTLCGYTGYYEGWALYSEFAAYDLMADGTAQNGSVSQSHTLSLEKLYKQLTLCLYSVLDIDIHYNVASLKDCISAFSCLGIRSGSLANAYGFIVRNPCYYPSYYVGYLELCRLKEYVLTLCGTDASDIAFHRFYLEYGPTDFETLRCIAGMLF